MNLDHIRMNAPKGAMFYCVYPMTCFDRPHTYLKVKWKILFGWNGVKWVFLAFPFRKGDELAHDYIILGYE
uniref:Uncharacterized protein n=2 Tax=unclassified bacterial viruses TaxID=12333 RepID=A0AAU8KW87_9VIRU